jgi:glucose-1-phosphate thymidylyltransferase
MAGMGKRLRPHTLNTPKPLLPVACTSIVEHLCVDIVKIINKKIDSISFIIGPNFGIEAEKNLVNIANNLGANGLIRYQNQPLGTAHAILCAENELEGEIVVAFADTLFKADFELNSDVDATIWVQEIEDPSMFGVVVLDANGQIERFVEKPKDNISNLAIIGIYHFKDGETLRRELQYLLDNNITEKGEYQLTNALDNMKNKGMMFAAAKVDQWMDCGNKDATVATNQQVLINKHPNGYMDPSVQITNSEIIQPCYIAAGVVLHNSKVGPYVSIGNHTHIDNAIIENSIIHNHSTISGIKAINSMIGSYCNIAQTDTLAKCYNVGDYTEIKN